MTHKYICEVVPVYLRPEPQLDEKACVGMILHCPETGDSAYRLVDENDCAVTRVANFFPRLKKDEILRIIQASRNDIASVLSHAGSDTISTRLANLIRPRENIIQYGTPQACLTDSLQEESTRLFQNFVALQSHFK